MPVPELTPLGVLPAGCHDCTLDEIQAAYCTNEHRTDLWTQFQAFMEWIATQPPPAHIIVDGGFTSDKAAPKDIDVVFDLSGCPQPVVGHWFGVFITGRAELMATHRVDFWVYHPGSGNDLRAFFEYVKPEEAIIRGMEPGDRKGILRIAL